MLFEIFLGLSALGAAGGVFLFKNRRDLGSLKNVVKLTLSDVEEQLEIPERVLPYSPTIMKNCKAMTGVLRTITHIMDREKNPFVNRYASLTARFNLMTNHHYDEDVFLHLTQEKRKFFSVFIPQVLSSFDLKDYDRAYDKSQYMRTFQNIYDYCLEVVTYYEEYQASKNDTKLLSIDEAIAEARGDSTPFNQSLPEPHIQEPLLTMTDIRFNALNISYHASAHGSEIRVHPVQNIDVTENQYRTQLFKYLNKLFEDKEKVTFATSFALDVRKKTYSLQKTEYNSVNRSFDIVTTPVDYYLGPLLANQSLFRAHLCSLIIVIYPDTNTIQFTVRQGGRL